MKYIKIVSNNPSVALHEHDERVNEQSSLAVLERVRDLVHLGHHLLTHPFAGSVKPNENPFKSVVVTKDCFGIDYQSVQMIEGCVEVARRMLREKPYRNYPPKVLEDLMLIDRSLLESGLESLRLSGKA